MSTSLLFSTRMRALFIHRHALTIYTYHKSSRATNSGGIAPTQAIRRKERSFWSRLSAKDRRSFLRYTQYTKNFTRTGNFRIRSALYSPAKCAPRLSRRCIVIHLALRKRSALSIVSSLNASEISPRDHRSSQCDAEKETDPFCVVFHITVLSTSLFSCVYIFTVQTKEKKPTRRASLWSLYR